jgi:Mg2+ and Co2+ transporter CorA
VAHANPDADDVDAEVLDQELAEVEERIDDFESIMNTARTIQKEAKSIEDELHGMERSIMRRLHRVKREVGIES